jgi:hypothetical protein
MLAENKLINKNTHLNDSYSNGYFLNLEDSSKFLH